MKIISLLSFFCSLSFSQNSLTITHLANDGFILESEGKRVEIDGFFKKHYPQFAVLSDSELELVKQAKAAYADIDLLLATHMHADHVNKDLIDSYLMSNKSSAFVASWQIVDSLKVKERVKSLKLNKSEQKSFTINALTIEALQLTHMGKNNKSIDNVGFIIHLGEFKILHVGDAELSEENYAKYKLADKKIDFLIIPFWQLTKAEDRELIEKLIKPKRIIASHISPNVIEKVKPYLPTLIEDVIVFENALESKTF